MEDGITGEWPASTASAWPVARARDWQARRGWRVGCNFIPSVASNPLEMWQEPTFDLATLEREIGYAAELGFTSLRVFLHHLPWQEDSAGFLERIEAFLRAAERHRIGALLVLFDGVWNPHPKPGAQPEPRARVHNAGWVQSPGAELLAHAAGQDSLEPYVKGVITRFRDDPRIDGWDLFNEPDNPNPAYQKQEIADKAERAHELLGKIFRWARAVDPVQPLTVGVWRGDWRDPAALDPIQRLSLEHSDVISFHCYGDLAELKGRVESLRRYERPLWCTEFMARTLGSHFDPLLGWMKQRGVGCYAWGLVAGRTQTQYPWDSWVVPYASEPSPWFHDLLRPDGSAYDPAEVAYIRSVTG